MTEILISCFGDYPSVKKVHLPFAIRKIEDESGNVCFSLSLMKIPEQVRKISF
jgi:hypothetical protein